MIEDHVEQMQMELEKWIHTDPRRIAILSELIIAIPLSRSVQGSDLAENVIRDVQDQSIQQMLRRFYKNPAITWERFYAPIIKRFLVTLYLPAYYLVVDTTDVGAKNRALVLSLSYHGRSIPLIWEVEPGTKGHTKEETQVKLVKRLAPHFKPKGAVIFLGDSEFDGVSLQKELREQGWYYIVRTSPQLHIRETEQSESYPIGELVPHPDSPEQRKTDILFTKTHSFGPVNCYACWEAGQEIPLILLSHLPADKAYNPRLTYRIRFSTEPLFADCKEAGFRLHKSRLLEPERLSRLFLAVSVSYLLMTTLGAWLFFHQDTNQVDRSNRRTLSIFKTGWRWFKRQLKLSTCVLFRFSFPTSIVFPPLKYT